MNEHQETLYINTEDVLADSDDSPSAANNTAIRK